MYYPGDTAKCPTCGAVLPFAEAVVHRAGLDRARPSCALQRPLDTQAGPRLVLEAP